MMKKLSSLPESLFWSAPLEQDSDFTAEDPLALDYLGQQVGLWLFKGFTTRTNRAQYYAGVLYGLYLVDEAIKKYNYPGDDKTRIHLFERWERFWALATLQYRDGQLERSDDDTMRGVRGASRAWYSGDKPLPLDFPLISRQSELGGLGAYLTSLREYKLVFPGSLRVTPAAKDIIDSFWSEPGKRDISRTYEQYALNALDLKERNISRKYGGLTLASLGDKTRLSSLVQHNRKVQQNRLWNALFVEANDGSTLPLSQGLITAHKAGVDDPETLLTGLLDGQWEKLETNVVKKVEVALNFGRLARVLLRRFNLAYDCVEKRGWIADFTTVAQASFPDKESKEIQTACKKLLDSHDVLEFSKLSYHGSEFIRLVRKLSTSGTIESLENLLQFHRSVQKTRRGGGSWLGEDHDRLVLQVPDYNGHNSEAGFPGMKLNVVMQLLADLGKLV